jgi:hypothetical protein
MCEPITRPDHKIVKGVIRVYLKSSLIWAKSCVNLSPVVNYKSHRNQMPGYLLSGKGEALAAVVLHELLLGLVCTAYQQRTAVKAYKPKGVKPATAVLRIKAPGTGHYVCKYLFYFVPCQGSTPLRSYDTRKITRNNNRKTGPYRLLHGLLKAAFPVKKSKPEFNNTSHSCQRKTPRL